MVQEVDLLDEEVVSMDMSFPDASGAQYPPIFKYKNVTYYYYKFGLVDYTKKERIEDEEEANWRLTEQEKRMEELWELRRRLKSAFRKNPKKIDK